MKSKGKSKETICRSEEARVRQYARDNRSDEEQLKRLIKRGAAGCKEAQRLRDRLELPANSYKPKHRKPGKARHA